MIAPKPMYAWSVYISLGKGKFAVYIVEALNVDIAIDACIRSYLREKPDAHVSEASAKQVSLQTPMKIMDSEDM